MKIFSISWIYQTTANYKEAKEELYEKITTCKSKKAVKELITALYVRVKLGVEGKVLFEDDVLRKKVIKNIISIYFPEIILMNEKLNSDTTEEWWKTRLDTKSVVVNAPTMEDRMKGILFFKVLRGMFDFRNIDGSALAIIAEASSIFSDDAKVKIVAANELGDLHNILRAKGASVEFIEDTLNKCCKDIASYRKEGLPLTTDSLKMLKHSYVAAYNKNFANDNLYNSLNAPYFNRPKGQSVYDKGLVPPPADKATVKL